MTDDRIGASHPPEESSDDANEIEHASTHKVTGKFQFIKHIGSGSFGDIYSGVDLGTNEQVAIKVESLKVNHPQLHNEYLIYHTYLKDITGFPKVYYYAQTKKHTYFVMSLLGHNLEYLLDICKRKFSVKTLLMLSDQLIERIGAMHDSSGYIHRDIKPENILMGRGTTKSTLFLLDLGLAKLYINRDTGVHIVPRKIRHSLTGTARYASINAHHGKDQSRRDDMESLGYVFIYLCKGALPWQGLKALNKKERYELICEKKMSTRTSELCFGLPAEYKLYLDYVKKLSFAERPDYDLLRGMFKEAMARSNYENDGVFDWFSIKDPQASEGTEE